jgi:hypothetical protein
MAGQQVRQLLRVAERDTVPGVDLVGSDVKAQGTTLRMKAGGKKRSSVHSTNRVGTSGQASSGHGLLYAACDSERSLLSASSARARGTSW